MRPIRRVNIHKALSSQKAILKKKLLNAIKFQTRTIECGPLLDIPEEDLIADALIYGLGVLHPSQLRSYSKYEVSIPISRDDYHRYGVYLEVVAKSVYPNADLHFIEEQDTGLTKATVSWVETPELRRVSYEPY